MYDCGAISTVLVYYLTNTLQIYILSPIHPNFPMLFFNFFSIPMPINMRACVSVGRLFCGKMLAKNLQNGKLSIPLQCISCVIHYGAVQLVTKKKIKL